MHVLDSLELKEAEAKMWRILLLLLLLLFYFYVLKENDRIVRFGVSPSNCYCKKSYFYWSKRCEESYFYWVIIRFVNGLLYYH